MIYIDSIYFNQRWQILHQWRFDFTHEGKRGTLSLGGYPATTLAMARANAEKFREMVAVGQTPSDSRKNQREQIEVKVESARRISAGETPVGSFEEVARRWFDVSKNTWMESHSSKVLRRLEIHAFPYIGTDPITDIDPPQVLELCRRIEKTCTLETAHRVLKICSQVFRFLISEGSIKWDPARNIRGSQRLWVDADSVFDRSTQKYHQWPNPMDDSDGFSPWRSMPRVSRKIGLQPSRNVREQPQNK